MTLLAKTLRRQVAALSCGCSLAIAGLGSQVASGATFTVSNTSDAGPGSFRQAIADANAAPGLDTIAFQILSPPFRISPGSALPAITDPTIIDATTQGSLVELDGSSAGAATVGLRLLSSNSVVRGLVINMFGLEGIHIEGPGSNVVAGNFIGTDITGTLNRGNGAATATSPSPGIFVLGSTGNLIGGTNGADRNVISGNAGAGVFIQNAGGNTVLGNYIGTTMLGTVSLGNGNNGISVYTSSQNTIGGVSSSARNVLAGNAGSGLYLQAGSSSNVIQGNYIGADVTGAAAMANAGDGITLQGSVNNLIGGTNNGAGNIISGNTKAGISFFGEAPDNLVQGNRIGTSASGSAALGNGLDGITLTNSPGNLIGGTTVAARNLISGNHQNGILILNGSFGTIIQGNFIGTSADGTNALANTQNGLNIETWDNTVGGTTSAARNLISGNGLDGIFIIGLGTTNNSVQGNYLGTRLNGASALHNGRAGLGVSSNAFYNLIGGTASG